VDFLRIDTFETASLQRCKPEKSIRESMKPSAANAGSFVVILDFQFSTFFPTFAAIFKKNNCL
jgi:hypothetical protein